MEGNWGKRGLKHFFLTQTALLPKKEMQFTLYFGVKSLPKNSVRVKCVTNSMSEKSKFCIPDLKQ